MSEEKNKSEKDEELKKLVLARINVMPPNYKLSVGNKGTFSKEQLMASVESGDEVGKQMVSMQMNFIKALTSGQLVETLNR